MRLWMLNLLSVLTVGFESRCPYELPIREMLKTVVEKLG